jgi:DNA-binding MarR family transcriptional regulator
MTDRFDPYILDVLMPDLVGHDRSPAAFVVYIYLLGKAARGRRDSVAASLQTIATDTGLSKSAVQLALRRLKRRGLVDAAASSTPANPVRQVMQPWLR